MAKNSKVKNKKVEGKKALCFMCNKEKSLNKQNFFSTMSNSEKHKQYESIGYILPCKDCLRSMCFDSNNIVNINKVHEALEYLDIPFIQEEFDKMIKDGEFDLGKYKQRMSINKKYRDLLYENSDDNSLKVVNYNNNDDDDEEEINNNFNIEKEFKPTKEMLEKWSDGFTEVQYLKLDSFYNDLCSKYDSSKPIQVNNFRNMAKIQLKADEALDSGDLDGYKKLMEVYSKLAGDSNIKPSQEKGDNESQEAFGVLVKKIEDTRPISEPKPEWKDVDGIEKNMNIFFFGHLAKMMGIKNDMSVQYEEEMNKYKVEVAREEVSQDGDIDE